MPVATPRRVDSTDLSQALSLIDAAARVSAALPTLTRLDVQDAYNSLALDLVAFAKELIKTEIPAEPEALKAAE